MPAKKLAISRTIIPFEYDPQGFNKWAVDIRNQVYVESRGFDPYQIAEEFQKVVKYHKPTKK